MQNADVGAKGQMLTNLINQYTERMQQLERGGEGSGLNQEQLDRLTSIIQSLKNEKANFAKRLAKANRDRIEKPDDKTAIGDEDDGSFRENYIHMKEAGLVFSTTQLSQRLRQPHSNRPVPFSKVYVCDFELDFVSKDDIDVFVKPMRELKQRNHYLTSEMEELTNSLETVQ